MDETSFAKLLTLRPLESWTDTVIKGDCRSAVLCMTSLSRLNDKYVSDESFTGGAFVTRGDEKQQMRVRAHRRRR